MTKSQNTKDEQQKDLCIISEQLTDCERNAEVSKTLTDKWKKGELSSGWYWVEGSRAEGIYAYTAEYLNNMYRPRNSEKIIALVPSYEKWEKFRNALADNQIENSNLLIENTKLKTENRWYSEQLNEAVKEVGHLKELLTMVKPVLQLEYNVTENRNLIKKINQVLGEE